ncbi:MAG TPA: CHC2 zinc finger domain-containing protein [Chitinophagaceae bacterium]|nr:CHC2 zinc finger domain-containing protein [Chitinophagaceae bacterium]
MTGENIEHIKSKLNIVEVIQDFVKLKKTGANFVGLCPFHAEKSGSFSVSPPKQIYKCFGCGKSGDAIQFLVEHENKSFVEAMEYLAKKYNIEIEEAGVRKEFIRPEPRLEKLDPKKIAWFESRKISNNTLLRMKITEAVEWMPQFQKDVPVICFNYYRFDELVNIKFRGPKKSFKLSKDAQLIFYNLDALIDEEEIVIVEGEPDCLSWIESGIHNVISVPNGAAKGNQKLEYLDNCWEYFLKIKKVIIAVDDDPAGRLLKEELARRIGKEKCWTVEYPKECKDSNDVLVKLGPQGIKDMYAAAKEWPLEGIMTMDEIYPVVDDWFEHGYPPGVKCGIKGFDHLLSFAPGQVTTVTGIPGHGKDEWLNWVKAMLIKKGLNIGDCGFEESPAETTSKIAEKLTGKSFGFRKNKDERMTKMQFDWAISQIDQFVHFYNTEEIETTLDNLLKIAILLVLRFGIEFLFLNPWNWIEQDREHTMSETDYVSKAYSRIIRFARKYGVHVFVVAHTTKMQKGKNGKHEIPTLYSISGGAHFYNKTNNGLCVYRDFETNVTDIYVQKVKQHWLGHVGFSSYRYDTHTRQYIFDSSNIKLPEDYRAPPPELGEGAWRPVEGPPLIDFSKARRKDEVEEPQAHEEELTKPMDDLPF